MHPGIAMVDWRTKKTNGKNVRFPLSSHHSVRIEKAVPYVDEKARYNLVSDIMNSELDDISTPERLRPYLESMGWDLDALGITHHDLVEISDNFNITGDDVRSVVQSVDWSEFDETGDIDMVQEKALETFSNLLAKYVQKHMKKTVRGGSDSSDMEERPFSSSRNEMQVGRYHVDWSSSKETIGVDLGDRTLFFAQGEQATPYLDIVEREGPKALLEELDSAGVLKFKATKRGGK